MSEFKGTPGPWRVLDRNERGDLWVGPESDPAILSNGVGIVMIRDLPLQLTPEQVAANAHLIAASWDMLEALQNIRSSAVWNRLNSSQAERVDTAIAKALGEVPS